MFNIYDTNGKFRNSSEGDYLEQYWLVGQEVNGGWTIGSITNEDGDVATKEKLAERVIIERNILLEASDYTQLPDVPRNTTEWATYRQKLRDLTTQPNFPRIEFPTPPEN